MSSDEIKWSAVILNNGTAVFVRGTRALEDSTKGTCVMEKTEDGYYNPVAIFPKGMVHSVLLVRHFLRPALPEYAEELIAGVNGICRHELDDEDV